MLKAFIFQISTLSSYNIHKLNIPKVYGISLQRYMPIEKFTVSFLFFALYCKLTKRSFLCTAELKRQLQYSTGDKVTLGAFLTLQSYLFQEYISLNPRRVEQNYTIYL